LTQRQILVVTESSPQPDGYYVDRILGTFESLPLACDFLAGYVPQFHRHDSIWSMTLFHAGQTQVLRADVNQYDRWYEITLHELNKGSSIGPDIDTEYPTDRRTVNGPLADIKQLMSELLHDV